MTSNANQRARIRPAVPADAEEMRRIVDAAYEKYVVRIGRKPMPMLDDYPRRVAVGEGWVAADESVDPAVTVGVLILEDDDDALLLENIAVAPRAHGTGVGRALMIFAEAEGRRRGYRTIRLYTNVMMTENIALYSRAGYVETGRISEAGFERVYMAKQLTP
jgi:GNAT superfamily N-acetyltransferase